MGQVQKNKYGFYSLLNPPTEGELEKYYAKKYYQDGKGHYEAQYSEEEIRYLHNKIEQKYFLINDFLKNHSDPSLLDIGSGEGWALQFFKNKGWSVTGIDYSEHSCKKFNPEVLDNLLLGDIYKNIQNLISGKKRFSVIWMKHVLEHVIDPLALLRDCRALLKDNGILVIEVPNDFSVIQNYLLDNKKINQQFWVVTPDHISYFSKESMDRLAEDAGFQNLVTIGDYPIDFSLINTDTNYISDPSKGKNCHLSRIEIENFMHSISVEKTNAYYKALADLGLGREVISFFKSR